MNHMPEEIISTAQLGPLEEKEVQAKEEVKALKEFIVKLSNEFVPLTKKYEEAQTRISTEQDANKIEDLKKDIKVMQSDIQIWVDKTLWWQEKFNKNKNIYDQYIDQEQIINLLAWI